jgi:hypothetical protein
MEANASLTSDALKHIQILWEEYKYRHDHIWQRTFRFTTAIVLISITPYLQQDIARLLGPWILIAPLLAFLLASFVLLVMRNELALFGRIKEAYRRQQNRLLPKDLEHPINEKSTFKLFVMTYFGCLVLLSIVNGFIVWRVWIPNLCA